MDSKCEKCFYYSLYTQPDYIETEEDKITIYKCGIYENGIPLKNWKEQCKEFIEK